MAKKQPTSPPDENAAGHPSEDRTYRHEVDALIRSYGFKIHSRRGDLAPLWSKCGALFTQDEVLMRLPRDEVMLAHKRQRLYREGRCPG